VKDSTFRTKSSIAPNSACCNIGGESRVEILCNGQQFVAYGIHPGTGKPYEWFGGDPLTVAVAALPEVSRDQAGEFLRAAEGILSS
jgi:putative DNA primase/helicase